MDRNPNSRKHFLFPEKNVGKIPATDFHFQTTFQKLVKGNIVNGQFPYLKSFKRSITLLKQILQNLC